MPTGIQAFLDLLDGFGVRYIFGNPGTTELPLNDALVDHPRMRYVLGLQELPVVSMADGYAMASGQLAVVNVHISCGLGNAMGMLYNAYREGTPLLLTAGQQDRRLSIEEPILWGDMVAVTRPWTKWSAEVQRVEDLPVAMRRAVQTALTPPTGPVFLSLPVDIQLQACDQLDLSPIRLPDCQVRPPQQAIGRAAKLLLSARHPGILAGSRVTERAAMDELVAVAEIMGAPVLSEPGTTHGRLAFPSDHPLNAQGLPLWSPEVLKRLEPFDVLLVVGMDLLRQYVYHEPACPIPQHTRLVHIDEDPWQLNKNYPEEVSVWGHTKTALQELLIELRAASDDAFRAAAAQRRAAYSDQHARQRQQLQSEIERQREARPITPLALMGAIAEIVPPDVAVIEEAVTTTNTTLERLGALKNTTGYFGHRGWALGWGLGCSLGAKLAWPDRPVLALLGEGAAMYGIAGLWTAARYGLAVTFVICNNAQYQILKIGGKGLGLPHALAGRFEGLDLTEPEIDFVGLAGALGIEALRAHEPDELRQHVRRGLASDRPLLIDVPISRVSPQRLEYG